MTTSLALQTVPSGSPTITDLINNILRYQYNPAGMQQVVFNYLNEVSGGLVTIVDPSNPYVHAIETGVVNTAAFLQQAAALTRRQYPVAAQLYSDLYAHMSDVDYVDRFATPATTTWSLLISETELLSKLVLDETTGLRQMVIPRNTCFMVGGIRFSLQYPVVIRQMAHGGLSITWDTTIASPLLTLSSNLVSWSYRKAADQTWIYMAFPVQQFDIITRTGTCSPSRAFQLTIPVPDQFYYCRVYAMNPATGHWDEIQVTYSTQIYDPRTPTAVVTLDTNTQTGGNQATVTIPQVYTTTGLLNQNIRIDVYETVGPLSMNLANYAASAFSATFLAIDPHDQSRFTAPMSTLQNLITYSDQVVTGGTNAVDFPTLRQQVIDHSVGPQSIPVTQAQITDVLRQEGFGVVRNIDNITDRTFLATAPMPQPANPALITAANSTIETLMISIDEAITNRAVIDNGSSITLTPDALYQNTHGVVSLVSDDVVNQLKALSVSNLALAVNRGHYLFTPFHYVLDRSTNVVALRPYYLRAPRVITKTWVGENDLTGLQVSTLTYNLETTATGYRLSVSTASNRAWQALDDSQVFCQLSFVPPGETARAWLNGTLTGKSAAGERIFAFDLSTNFYVDADNHLYLTRFLMYNSTSGLTAAPLKVTFDVLYSTDARMPATWQPGAVDSVVGRHFLPANTVGITNEQLLIRFGHSLDTLWARCRTVVSTLQYQTHQTNVPYYYLEDVYAIDPQTGSVITIVNGQAQFQILHHKGDPVLNADGTPSYQFMIGDVILDGMGNPIPVNPRGVAHQLDLMMIDATYRFATDTVAPAYLDQLVSTVVGWLTTQFETLNRDLLENTTLYYYPVASMGTVQVYDQNGLIRNIRADQSLAVTCLVSTPVFNNEHLKQQLRTATVSTISSVLREAVISNDMIYTALRQVFGNDVISFVVQGLGGASDLTTLTLVDDSTQLGIGKQLVANADGTLSVQEAVNVSFVEYTAGTR